MLEYYNNIDKEKLCDGFTQIVAMDFGEYVKFLYNSFEKVCQEILKK